MAYSSSTGSLQNALQLRAESKRRRMEEMQEPKVKTPSFNEPRKLSSTNPDHLTKEIRQVLGPMEKISKVIANNPNDWLGTSRSSSCKPSTTSSTPGCNPRSRGTNRNEGPSSNVSQQPSHHPPSNNGRFETCPRPGSSENELSSRFLPTSCKPPKSDSSGGFQHNIESSGSNRSSTCPPNKNEAYPVQSTPPANDIAFARNVSNETPGLKTNKDTSFSTSAPMLKGKNTAEENCDGDDSQPTEFGSVVGLLLDLFDMPTFKSRLFTDDVSKPVKCKKEPTTTTTAHGDQSEVDKDGAHLHKDPHVGSSSSVAKFSVDHHRNATYDAESDSDSSDDEEVDNEQCDDSETESRDKTNPWILGNWDVVDQCTEVAPTATDKRRDGKKDVAASTPTDTESINEAPCTETDMEANRDNKPVLPSSYHRHAPEVVDKPNKHHTSENSDSSRHRFSPAPGKRPSSTNHHHQELQQHRTPTKYSNINGGSSGSQQTTHRSLRAEKPAGSSSRSHHRNNQHQSSTNDATPSSRTSSSHKQRSEYDQGSSNSSSHSSSRSRRPMVKNVTAKGAASSPVTVPPPTTKPPKSRGSKNNADSKSVVSGKPSKNVSTISSGRSPYTGKERSKTHHRTGRTAKREAPVTIEQEMKRSDSENSLSTSSSGEDSDHEEAVQNRQAVMPPTISDRYQSSMSSPNKPPSASSRHGSAVRSSHDLKETAATAPRHCEEVRPLSRQDSSSSIASYSSWKRKDGSSSSSKPSKKRPATSQNTDDSTSLRERTDGSKYSDHRSSSKELPHKKRRETSKSSKERSRRQSSGHEQKTIKNAREALFHPLFIIVTTTTDCDSKRRSKPGSESSRRRKHENGGEAHRDASRRSTKSSPPRKSRIAGVGATSGGGGGYMPVSQSTGSETDKPISRIRASDVRVCPASTSDISHLGKHKNNSPPGLLEHPSSSYSGRRQPFDLADGVPSSKRAKTLTNEENASRRAANGVWMGDSLDAVSQFRESRRDHTNGEQSGGTVQVWSGGSHVQPQENRSENDKMVLICQTRPNTIVSEPDSSWPEQERLMQSDQYMDEGKRLKHEADRYFDVNTYRSPVDILRRGLIYFEASLAFTMNGHMLEVENEKSNESGGSSSTSSLSPSSMYDQTIPLFEHIRKLNNGDQQHAADFRRLTVSCLRAEALLHLRIFNLKKESASKNLEQLQEQFKQARVAANNRTPSPWRANGQTNQQQQQGVGNNIVSPISPAVPSPYGSINAPGPSPAAGSTCSSGTSEHVSSSTQVAGAFLAFPVKAYENFKSYHQIVHHLVVAHQHWDEAQRQQAEDEDFFRNVEALTGLTLTLHSSLRDMVNYLKAVLHRMRVKSPKE